MGMRIGLTGGVASGKSKVSALFAQFGVPVIDADIINRQLLQKNSPVFTDLINMLGKTVLDQKGEIDRRELRQRIFTSPELKQQIEALLHPVIRQKMLTAADHCDYPYCILAIPLLVEANMQSVVDRILVVDLDEIEQKQRLITRDNISNELAEAMIRNQCTRQQRLQFADDIIDNNGQESMLADQVLHLHQFYLTLTEQCH